MTLLLQLQSSLSWSSTRAFIHAFLVEVWRRCRMTNFSSRVSLAPIALAVPLQLMAQLLSRPSLAELRPCQVLQDRSSVSSFAELLRLRLLVRHLFLLATSAVSLTPVPRQIVDAAWCACHDRVAEFACRLDGDANQDPRVSREGERDARQVLHPHSPGNGNRRYLAMSTARSPTTWQPNILDVLRSVIEFAEANLAPVNDRARRRIEPYHCGHYIVCPTSVCFGEANLGIFRLREASGWSHFPLG